MKSSTVKEDIVSETFYYEDDNLKIFYDLWSHSGTLSFTILNKTNRPIYFDWANSNFIWNGYSIDYIKDVEIIRGINSSAVLNNGIMTQGFSIKTKDKPQTQLPPNAQIVIHKFNIDMPFVKIDSENKKIKEVSYTEENSFFKFRNYLAYSFDKELKNLTFIDHSFWVSQITEMLKYSFVNNIYPNSELKKNKCYSTKKEANPGEIAAIIGVPIVAGVASVLIWKSSGGR